MENGSVLSRWMVRTESPLSMTSSIDKPPMAALANAGFRGRGLFSFPTTSHGGFVNPSDVRLSRPLTYTISASDRETTRGASNGYRL